MDRSTGKRRGTVARRTGAILSPEPDTEIGFDELVVRLDAALREQARLWREMLTEGKYELLYHHKPTQRDVELAVREHMADLPEILRWRLARIVGGPLSHE